MMTSSSAKVRPGAPPTVASKTGSSPACRLGASCCGSESNVRRPLLTAAPACSSRASSEASNRAVAAPPRLKRISLDSTPSKITWDLSASSPGRTSNSTSKAGVSCCESGSCAFCAAPAEETRLSRLYILCPSALSLAAAPERARPRNSLTCFAPTLGSRSASAKLAAIAARCSADGGAISPPSCLPTRPGMVRDPRTREPAVVAEWAVPAVVAEWAVPEVAACSMGMAVHRSCTSLYAGWRGRRSQGSAGCCCCCCCCCCSSCCILRKSLVALSSKMSSTSTDTPSVVSSPLAYMLTTSKLWPGSTANCTR
mmetsp:Transcript_65775/g.106044  ORF Transcript_65775/g.106044 Transcript_65775/m.106044 type:complete len:312 (-) Transcript_65775:765-1700(-)